MQIVPFLLLRRTHLLTAAGASLLIVVAALFQTSADSLESFGVLWHHACGCPPDPSDTRILLYTPLAICLVAAIRLGISNSLSTSNTTSLTPMVRGEAYYLLTRPTSRFHLIATPLILATLTLFILPILAWAVLLGWLALVNAPSLIHLAALMHLIPSVALLGPHPSLLQITLVPTLIRHYLAAISVGLCAYALFASQRWLILAPNQGVRLLGAFVTTALSCLPVASFLFGKHIYHWLLLIPGSRQTFESPSFPAILAHFLFAAGWFAFTLYTVRRLEL